MFCKNQLLRYVDIRGNPHIQYLGDLEQQLQRKKYLKKQIKNRKLTLIPCGKCPVCLESKKRLYQKRVTSHFKLCEYAYLITITFNNEIVQTLLTKEQQQDINNKDIISYYSTLSKTQISNIIKNWKNKFNRYYKRKVSFHYMISGEYGGNTERAHYHIILMLDVPIPNLVKIPVKGQHFKSKFMESKQYNHYDIEPAYLSDGKKTSLYLTKYLTKDTLNETTKEKYNRFQEKQIKYFSDNNIDLTNGLVVKSKEQLQELLLWYEFYKDGYIYIPNIEFKNITFQKEFIKISRRLGISENQEHNVDNNTFTPYYRNKYIEQELKKEPQDFLNDSYNFIQKGDYILNKYERKRRNNIERFIGKETKITKRNKNNKDIF